MIYFIFLAMVFCHVLDDYVLQAACLKDLKQESFWKKYDEKYRDDWMIALFFHAFSWSFMIHLPIAIYVGFDVSLWFILSVVINTIIHAIVDHLKCNRYKINLFGDQIIHLWQIAITFILFFGKGSTLL